MKNTKRIIAFVLSLCMVLCLLPTGVFAVEPSTGTAASELTATELEGMTRLDGADEAEAEPKAAYADDEIVTVIVLMEEPAVLKGFSDSAFINQTEGLSAGGAVSAYLTSDAAQLKAEKLLAGQQTLINQISAVVSKNTGAELEVKAQWTNLVNAMSIRVPYGQLAQIQTMDGVLNAYVEQTFERPADPETDAGVAGYSYDLVDLSSVWAAGYYGEGMVVAVLDTGLDLDYTTWGDSADPQTGIRMVHEAFTGKSFKTDSGKQNVRYTAESMQTLLASTQLYANTGDSGQLIVFDNNALYKNLKVPFAFDYADWDLNVRPESSDHGTHVSGTIAGYAETAEGEVKFSGVAPDAQLLSMKVFDDYGSSGYETAIICALEDAALLGADVVNLSLGSDNGFSVENTVAYFVYETLNESGVLFMVSAGNSYASSMSNKRGDLNLSSDPETSMLSTPSTYDSTLSIASMDNTVDAESTITWTDTDGTTSTIAYSDPYDVAMKSSFAGQQVAVIPVEGTGTYSDYYNAGFRSYYGYSDKGVTGIALVKRGELSFEEKVANATSFVWSYYNSALGYYVTEYPIKAVIVYDDDPTSTDLIYMGGELLMTCCFINGVDGAALYEAATAAIANGTNVYLTVDQEDRIVENETAGEISVYTSWGATPGLELKPEITAPGGNIWSAVLDYNYTPSDYSTAFTDYTGTYAMMSGTSMAAPHMTGIAALVKQYVQTEHGLTGAEAARVTQQLLVSTAVPMVEDETYYAPRVQGAGLVNAGAAITTPAYITVEGQNVGKIELLDDPEKTGEYEMTFTVNNLTGEALTYNATAHVLRPGTETDEAGHTYMMDSDVLIKEVDFGTVTVPANGSVTVSGTVTLTAEEKAQIEELFPNGTYIEGYITLTSETEPQIGLPFLAFYGDWTTAPIFDSATWLDSTWDSTTATWDADTTWGTSIVGYFDGYSYYNLGQNVFDPTAYDLQSEYLEENITLAPGSGLFQSINDFVLYQLRDAKSVVIEARDKNTGELYYRDYVGYLTKTVYWSSYGYPIPTSVMYFTDSYWTGTDLNGNILPNGTECIYTITAYGDGDYGTVEEDGYVLEDIGGVIPGEHEPTFNGHAMDTTGDVIEFEVLIDTVAPKLVNSAVSTYVGEDGHTYITGTFKDDGSLASIEIYPQVKRTYNTTNNPYADPTYYEYGLDENNPFLSEMFYDADLHEWTFTADVTEYVHANESYSGENRYYNFEWTGNIYIFGGDYGGNDRAYAVSVSTGEGLILSTTSAKLYVGDSFDLNVINNTGSDAPLTRISTNPEVATVDEFGHIEALSAGQTEIVVSNGTEEVVCIVAVEDVCFDVIDFDLSLTHFEGLKPGGAVVVEVTNLEPADVVITENIWLVSENDPDLYEGLITCSKYDVTGMSAEVYLNYEVNTDALIPGAAGTLEVTLNGVTRTMELTWEDLYTSYDQDDMASDSYYGQQTIYVEMGETAELVGTYRQSHSFIDVELYTMEGYESYSYNNPTTEATGVVLDGPTWATNGARWEGKLVALPGYELPSEIKVCTRYDYGYESEMYPNSYGYSYDPTTGDIVVYYAPSGATNTLVIRADGVAAEGAAGGSLSGTEYEKPDGQYGPFDWTVTEGTGELTTGTVQGYYETKDAAFYTPSEPGVSYITASSKDGQYSVNFAVICTGVQAEKLDVAEHKISLRVGDTYQLQPVLDPVPTLDIDKMLTYKSFNEGVVTVDENGLLTAAAEGYAYIEIETKSGADVETYVVVEVLPCLHTCYSVETPATCTEPGYVTHTCMICGAVIVNETEPALGHDWSEWVEREDGSHERTCATCGETQVNPFIDVHEDSYYFDAVLWAVEKGITTGYGPENVFAPYADCTRAQVVTMLWRAAGCPAPENAENPFEDVAQDAYYYEAVLWAVEKGITTGATDVTFEPEETCTRGQIVTFLWRAAGEPAAEGESCAFTDVAPEMYYYAAVLWAAEQGITNGKTADTFGPDIECERCEIITMLYRAMN